MKNEIRKSIALIFINWAFYLLPDCEFKTYFSEFIINNIDKL